jgi:putative hydrolase of the HAD superfamily
MNKKYQHILFDLDHTLWDFEKSSNETLTEIYHHFKLGELGSTIHLDLFLTTFSKMNQELWRLYNRKEITQEQLRYGRFPKILAALDIYLEEEVNILMVDYYLKNLSSKPYLIPFAKEVLDYLQNKYELHIITNGFEEIQHLKLQSSDLQNYFGLVVTSSSAGVKKPEKRIFDFTVETLNTRHEHCIMIGDNLETDILGAKDAGIDHIYFNPQKEIHQEDIQIEIDCLSQLMNIL